MTPRLGLFNSLRFAWDVPGFLRRGRALGRANGRDHFEGPAIGPWAFTLAGERVTVLSTAAALRDEAAYYRGEVLAPLLGEHSPLAVEGEAHLAARDLARRPAGLTPPRPYIEDVLAEAMWPHAPRQRRTFGDAPRLDIVPILRRAAMRVALASVREAFGFTSTPMPMLAREAVLERLLHAGERASLVVPALRPFSWAWRDLAPARRDLLVVLGLGEASVETQDAAVTYLVGAVTNTALLAARAAKVRAMGWAPNGNAISINRDTLAVAEAAKFAPVPLALRRVVRPYEVDGLQLAPGDAIAVDLAAAAISFGAGARTCPGASAARAFARAALAVLDDARLVADPRTAVERRVGLAWGIAALDVGSRAAGA